MLPSDSVLLSSHTLSISTLFLNGINTLDDLFPIYQKRLNDIIATQIRKLNSLVPPAGLRTFTRTGTQYPRLDSIESS